MKAWIAIKQRTLLTTLLSIVMILTLFSAAGAQTPTGGSTLGGPIPAGGGGAVPGGPGYVAIPALAFKPYFPSTTYTFMGTLLANTSGGGAYFDAPFVIPNGATITKMVVYYEDSVATPGVDLNVCLIKLPYFATSSTQLACFYSSGSLTGMVYGEATTITTPVVDLSMNAYAIEALLPNNSNVALNAVRIDYTYSLALPTIVK